MSTLPKVNLAGARALVEASFKANTNIELIGAPGIGKTSIVNALGAKLGVSVESLILSQCDQSDVGGIPVPIGDQLSRLPVGPIKRASERGSVLFLDEFGNAHSAIKGAALTLLQERYAGDTRLHPDTRIVLASNPTDQAEGGHEYGAPTIGRLTRVHVVPDLAEVSAYFETLGAGSTFGAWALDFALTLAREPRLLQIDPPPGSVRAGRAWGSPRAWERALRLVSALIEAGYSEDSDLVRAAFAGNVSEETGGSFLAIREVRKFLPSIEEIIADPTQARLPADLAQESACVGLLPHVGAKSSEAVWIYASRLSAEMQTVVYRGIMRFQLDRKSASKSLNVAIQAQQKVLAQGARAGKVQGWGEA